MSNKPKYYTILTKIGREKLAQAQVNGTSVNLVEMAVGSSKREPSEEHTKLGNEEWRGLIGRLAVDRDNPSWIITEVHIPAEASGKDGKGFSINEVGIFDSDGDMIVIAKYPETFKPVLSDGTSKELIIKLISEVTNSNNVQLTIDPSIVMASKKYVDDKFKYEFKVEMEEFEKDIIRRLEELKFQVDMNSKGLQRLMIQMELDDKIEGGTAFFTDFSGSPKNMTLMEDAFILEDEITPEYTKVKVKELKTNSYIRKGMTATIFDDENSEDVKVLEGVKDGDTLKLESLKNSYKKGALLVLSTNNYKYVVVNVKGELL